MRRNESWTTSTPHSKHREPSMNDCRQRCNLRRRNASSAPTLFRFYKLRSPQSLPYNRCRQLLVRRSQPLGTSGPGQHDVSADEIESAIDDDSLIEEYLQMEQEAFEKEIAASPSTETDDTTVDQAKPSETTISTPSSKNKTNARKSTRSKPTGSKR